MSRKPLKRATVEPLNRSKTKASPPLPVSTFHHFNAFTLTIANRQRVRKINSRLLKQIVSALLAELEVKSARLGINFIGAKEMARLNWHFLQHEGSTDVITFDHREPAPVIHHSALQIHGELFISLDDAIAQAKDFRSTWQSEVIRYIIHGVLHLLGHDDLKSALRRAMKREENRLVRLLGKRFSFARLSFSARISA